MNTKRIITAILAAAVLTLTTAGGCEDSQGRCKPGATRAAHGHTDVCGKDGKWHPYVKPTVKPVR